MTRFSKFCKNSNYFCKCAKCKLAIEEAKKLEFSALEHDIRVENDCKSSKGRLNDDLMREIL